MSNGKANMCYLNKKGIHRSLYLKLICGAGSSPGSEEEEVMGESGGSLQ